LAQSPLFDTGFPGPTPSVAEVDSLPTRIAQSQGVRIAAEKRLKAEAEASLAGPMASAQHAGQILLQPVEDALADAGQEAASTVIQGQVATVNALQAPLAVGIRYGYQPQGTPLVTPTVKQRRSRRPASPIPPTTPPWPSLPPPPQSPTSPPMPPLISAVQCTSGLMPIAGWHVCLYEPQTITWNGALIPPPYGVQVGTQGFWSYTFGLNQDMDAYLNRLFTIEGVDKQCIWPPGTAPDVVCASPASPPPPSPPLAPPPTPPPSPSPPPPPGCVHVCIDNWPAAPTPPPPPPSPPPSPPPRQEIPPSTTVPPGITVPAVAATCFPWIEMVGRLSGKTLRQIWQDRGILTTSGDIGWLGPALAWVDNNVNVSARWLVRPIIEMAAVVEWSVLTLVEGEVQAIVDLTGCGDQQIAGPIIISLITGLYEKYIAALPEIAKAPVTYLANWTCPKLLPGVEWANEAFARAYINEEQWKCLVRTNGFVENWQRTDAQLRQRQPSPENLLLLARKGVLTFGDTFDMNMGLLGWTDTNGRNLWVQAQDWVPSPTDAIEWMIKDVADPQIQETFKLDAEFGLKYQGHVKEVFDWNGIKAGDAENIWRAHWRNMAPTTLYELHKRLRPGWTDLMSDDEAFYLAQSICPRQQPSMTEDYLTTRPESNGWPVPTLCHEIPNGPVAKLWLESLTTSGYHVYEGLGQSDYPAFWRSRLLAVSYKVMTRIDARRAYETGQITLDRLRAVFQDLGYAPQDAAAVSRFYREAAIQLHARRPVCNQWVTVGYDPNLLRDVLVKQGMREDMWNEVADILIARRRIKVQADCIAQIKAKFLKGKLSDQDARTQLLSLPMPIEDMNILMIEWSCQLKVADKQETAANICEEFRAGLITGRQAQQLLRQQGYSGPAARRILSLCYLRVMPKTRHARPLPGSQADTAMQQALDGG